MAYLMRGSGDAGASGPFVTTGRGNRRGRHFPFRRQRGTIGLKTYRVQRLQLFFIQNYVSLTTSTTCLTNVGLPFWMTVVHVITREAKYLWRAFIATNWRLGTAAEIAVFSITTFWLCWFRHGCVGILLRVKFNHFVVAFGWIWLGRRRLWLSLIPCLKRSSSYRLFDLEKTLPSIRALFDRHAVVLLVSASALHSKKKYCFQIISPHAANMCPWDTVIWRHAQSSGEIKLIGEKNSHRPVWHVTWKTIFENWEYFQHVIISHLCQTGSKSCVTFVFASMWCFSRLDIFEIFRFTEELEKFVLCIF